MLVIAGLSMTRGLFYATAATVIPVLALARIIEIGGLALRGVRLVDEVAAKVKTKGAAQKWLVSQATAQVHGAIGWLVIILTGVPVAAEIFAFIALARDNDTGLYVLITVVGLGFAGLLFLAPIFRVFVVVAVGELPSPPGNSDGGAEADPTTNGQ